MKQSMAIGLLIFLLVFPPWHVYEYDTTLGEPVFVIEGGRETYRVAVYGWIYFEAARRCWTITATHPPSVNHPQGIVVVSRETSECGATLPLVVGP